ncbi:MAG: RNA polymerase sigma factor [Saprospiraceae bacterium]|nr:RNA polymerase sigma factor [Saprospiraceae bacterium]
MNLEQLVEKCKSQSSRAEKELFFRLAPKVLTLCRRYTKDEALAQDYLQECFLTLFKNIKKYDAAKGPFEAWFYRLCTNRILQSYRKSKREPEIEFRAEVPEQSLPEESLEAISEEQLLAAIRQLPDGYRQVLNLAIFDGWTHKEIANKLGITESTSRSQLARAKRLLKQFLQPLTKKNYAKRPA